MAGFSLKNNEISYNTSVSSDVLTLNNTGVLNIKPSTTGTVSFSNEDVSQQTFAQLSSASITSTNLVLRERFAFGLNKRMYYGNTSQRVRGLHQENSLQTIVSGLSSTTATNVHTWLSPVVSYTPRFSDSIIMVEAFICSECYNRGTDDDFTSSVGIDEVDINGTTILRAGQYYDTTSTSSNSRNIGFSNAFQSANAVNHGEYSFINTRPFPAIRSSDGLVRARGGGRIYNDTSSGFGAFLDITGLTVFFQEYV
jgi:hypothetical protein